MKIENFAPRACGDPSGLLVIRFGTALDEGALRMLHDTLAEAKVVDPPSRGEGKGEGKGDDEGGADGQTDEESCEPSAPAEVVALPWRPPPPEAADAQRELLESIGRRFGVERAWCFQSRYGLDAGIRAGWFPESLPDEAADARRKLAEATSDEEAAGAIAELASVLGALDPADGGRDGCGPAGGPGGSRDEWTPDRGGLPFPIDGYPQIIDELDWYDFGIAIKLGGPRLAGEEQVVRAFNELWFKSFGRFRHVGVEYDPVRRAAVLWTDRWTFPETGAAVVHHTLWIASRLHQIIPIIHARFQEAEMAWKYRGLTGDGSEPFILAGNPFDRVFHSEGEQAALSWAQAQTAWSDQELAAMIVEVVEQHAPDDHEASAVAIRLAEWALTHDPDQNQARADILFTLVVRGLVDEALDRARQWAIPGITAHLLDLIAEHAPDRVPAAVDVALGHVRTGKRSDLAVRVAKVAAEHSPDRVLSALAQVPTPVLVDWADNSPTGGIVQDAIHLIAKHAPDRLADVLSVLKHKADGLTALAWLANVLAQSGGFSEALTVYDAILDVDELTAPLWAYNNALWTVAADNNKLPVQPERARSYLAACLPHGPENPAIFYNAACVWFELDELDRTFECLRLAREHEYNNPIQMRDEPLFRSIADDPRFREIFTDLDGVEPCTEPADVPF